MNLQRIFIFVTAGDRSEEKQINFCISISDAVHLNATRDDAAAAARHRSTSTAARDGDAITTAFITVTHAEHAGSSSRTVDA